MLFDQNIDRCAEKYGISKGKCELGVPEVKKEPDILNIRMNRTFHHSEHTVVSKTSMLRSNNYITHIVTKDIVSMLNTHQIETTNDT